jgi:hypothetical protein
VNEPPAKDKYNYVVLQRDILKCVKSNFFLEFQESLEKTRKSMKIMPPVRRPLGKGTENKGSFHIG